MTRAEIGSDVSRAAELLRNGGIVAIPTETVYGLAANAHDTGAVARVFDAKNRPRFDPLIVHVAEAPAVKELADEVPPLADRLIEHFWPGPLTVVLPKSERVPDLVTAGLPKVAVRSPDHPLARELLIECAFPLAAPSANPFGMISPTTAEHVADQLAETVDYILDGGPCRVGLESTVIGFDGDSVKMLRLGGVSAEELRSAVGHDIREGTTPGVPESPGQLPRHYAPHTRLRITTEPSGSMSQRIGLLSATPISGCSHFAAIEVLSPTGDLNECAANFFAALRRLDALRLDEIQAVPFEEQGLGRALNDRLRRAAT